MNRLVPLVIIAMGFLAFATLLLVILPAAQIRTIEPPAALAPYTPEEARGRAQYVALGCVYCHSQQPRPPEQAPDVERGWGRPSTAADYVYDRPHLLGTMRTGPDLLNVGVRLPSRDWHLTHLYQPRAVIPTSLMPAFTFLFEVKAEPAPDDVVVALPPGQGPEAGVVVATPAALDLTAYLLSLDRSYPAERPDLRDNGFVPSARDDVPPRGGKDAS